MFLVIWPLLFEKKETPVPIKYNIGVCSANSSTATPQQFQLLDSKVTDTLFDNLLGLWRCVLSIVLMSTMSIYIGVFIRFVVNIDFTLRRYAEHSLNLKCSEHHILSTLICPKSAAIFDILSHRNCRTKSAHNDFLSRFWGRRKPAPGGCSAPNAPSRGGGWNISPLTRLLGHVATRSKRYSKECQK